jgi:hypothetical protein
MAELKGAVEDGFSDTEKMQELLDDERIRAADKDEISQLIADVKRAAEEAAKAADDVTDDTNDTDVTKETSEPDEDEEAK